MKPEIAEKLVAALRSGEFEQGTGALHRAKVINSDPNKVGHCCLGVLSEIAVDEGIIEKRYDEAGTYGEFGTAEDFDIGYQQYSYPPSEVGKWAELVYREDDPVTIFFDMTGDERVTNHHCLDGWHKFNGRIIVSACELNDNFGFSFNDIADLIESGKIVTDLPDSSESDYAKAWA